MSNICATVLLFFSILSIQVSAQPAQTLEKLQEQQRQQSIDLAVLEKINAAKLDAQDKRISDLNLAATQQSNQIAIAANQTTQLGNLIAITGVVITLLVFAAGLITYFSVTAKAKTEAKQAAQDWFRDNSNQLTAEVKQLQNQAAKIGAQMTAHEANVADASKAAVGSIAQQKQAFDTACKQALSSVTDKSGASQPRILSDESKAAIEAEGKRLRAKPEEQFTAADHFVRGLEALTSNNFAVALDWFDKANSFEGSKPEQSAMYLFAKAFALGELNRSEDAIAVSEQIEARYGKDDNPAMRELVAKALFNKGVQLDQLNRSEDAIAVYEQIEARYSKDDNPALRELVAKALVNKGGRLGQLNRYEDEITVYEQIEARYGKDESPALREHVAQAKNGQGFSLLMLAKQRWALETEREKLLVKACDALLRAKQHTQEEHKAMVLGNLGYANWLLGNIELAEEATEECLKLGGKEMLNAQKTDASLHRVEQVDAAYEQMLNRMWQKITP
jgi:tetratricopeptide (TPR) repeat protein